MISTLDRSIGLEAYCIVQENRQTLIDELDGMLAGTPSWEVARLTHDIAEEKDDENPVTAFIE